MQAVANVPRFVELVLASDVVGPFNVSLKSVFQKMVAPIEPGAILSTFAIQRLFGETYDGSWAACDGQWRQQDVTEGFVRMFANLREEGGFGASSACDYFKHTLVKDKLCLECGAVCDLPVKDDEELVLAYLDRPLQSSLTHETLEEIVVHTNCGQCGHVSTAGRQLSRHVFNGSALMVQAVRWEVSAGVTRKLDGEVRVSEEMELPSETGVKRFVLASCVCHFGDTPLSGHYVSYRKDAEENWWECNDYTVAKVGSFSAVRATFAKRGYMFVFCVRDSL